MTGARVIELPPDPKYAFIHFNYVDATHFIEKLNRYTTIEAGSHHSRGSIQRGFALTLKEFLRRYVKQRGYRDGWRGLYLAAAMAFYRLTAVAKRLEAESGGRPEVEDGYRRVAEAVLSGYSSATSTSPQD
jgi:(heptosyl)LPS beta-1,4-glucosyltransferase